MHELKFELGQIGMRRGSVDSVSPTDIRHVDEWTMDLTAAEKRRLQKAEATATNSHSQKPRFYLNETRVEVIIANAFISFLQRITVYILVFLSLMVIPAHLYFRRGVYHKILTKTALMMG